MGLRHRGRCKGEEKEGEVLSSCVLVLCYELCPSCMGKGRGGHVTSDDKFHDLSRRRVDETLGGEANRHTTSAGASEPSNERTRTFRIFVVDVRLRV